MRIACVDIGGTFIKTALYENGTLSPARETPTEGARGAEALMDSARSLIRAMGRVDAVGVCTRGQVACDRGVILFDPPDVIPGYTGTNVAAALSVDGVPVAVENDVNCMALAEALTGAGRGVEELVCLTYGTAIGGAIVRGGRVCHGASWSAGEFGMTYVRGEWYEKIASATALVRMAQQADGSIRSGRDVAARLDEAPVYKEVCRWAALAAEGLATLVHAFDPGAAVLGGGIMENARLFALVQERTRALLAPGFSCRIMQARHGNRAGLLGAALLGTGLLDAAMLRAEPTDVR